MKAAIKNRGQTDYGIHDPLLLDRLYRDEIELWGSAVTYKDWVLTQDVPDSEVEYFGCSYPVSSRMVPGSRPVAQEVRRRQLQFAPLCQSAT